MKLHFFNFLSAGFLMAGLFFGCKTGIKDTKGSLHPVLVDSIVYADVETNPVNALTEDDAADDPAVWIHPSDPSKNMIVGTNKKAGVFMYNLAGEEIHFYPVGDANNIDVRYAFQFGNGTEGRYCCLQRAD